MARNMSPKPTPWSYFLIRLLFKFVLKVFYGTIVIENEDYIPKNGEPVIVCANHTNSLTDALILISSVSSHKRNFLRLTAKDTQFGRKTFQSWLIENAGTVPIKRRMDHAEGASDNSDTMAKLMEALEEGDAVCLFPEGFSRYHPTMAPLKTGVARIVSDTLSRNAENPEFGVTILTCSITYMHRQSFRSDVLVSFNPPLKLTVGDNPNLISKPGSPVDFANIRSLTSFMHAQLSSNTIDAPTWDLVRTAKTAARIYAPLGTAMGLGDWVRVVARFVAGFAGPASSSISNLKAVYDSSKIKESSTSPSVIVNRPGSSSTENRAADASITEGSVGEQSKSANEEDQTIVTKREKLASDLRAYQDQLLALGLKDDRIRRTENTPWPVLLWRFLIRSATTLCLLTIALPGLVLWIPIFLTTAIYVKRLKRSGPTWDTHDEVAQTKLIYGLASGSFVWLTVTAIATIKLPLHFILALVLVPSWMWLTLRWTEDLVSSFRASLALYRLLVVDKTELKRTREVRKDLLARVMELAELLDLPSDPEREFLKMRASVEEVEETGWIRRKDRKGTVGGRWDSARKYFSIRRRRKRDWNETLRWFDATEFPKDE